MSSQKRICCSLSAPMWEKHDCNNFVQDFGIKIHQKVCLMRMIPALVLHKDPAAHQDYCGRSQIRARDHCLSSLARSTIEPPHEPSRLHDAWSFWLDSLIDSLINSLINSLIDSFINSLIDSLINSLIDYLINSLIYSLIDSFLNSLIYSLIDSLINSLINSWICPMIESLINPLIDSLIASLIDK